jgi:hypothetical protein
MRDTCPNVRMDRSWGENGTGHGEKSPTHPTDTVKDKDMANEMYACGINGCHLSVSFSERGNRQEGVSWELGWLGTGLCPFSRHYKHPTGVRTFPEPHSPTCAA